MSNGLSHMTRSVEWCP